MSCGCSSSSFRRVAPTLDQAMAKSVVGLWGSILTTVPEFTAANGFRVSRTDDGLGFKVQGKAVDGRTLDLMFQNTAQAEAWVEQFVAKRGNI
jgi:hypothetical protein